MPIHDTTQLYATVREIVAALRQIEADALAEQLESALSVSSSPYEIIGEIHLALRRIQADPIYPRLGAAARLVEPSIDFINRCWDGA
jgi:hypothetical protein